MQSDRVEMGRILVRKEVSCPIHGPRFGKSIVNESIRAILPEHLSNPHYNPTSVIIGPGGAVVLTGRTAEHERLQDLVELARKLESAAK
jgi:hypothetical protein